MNAHVRRGDDVFPIAVWRNSVSGKVRYAPVDQNFVDNAGTLEAAGLIHTERDEDGRLNSVFVLNPNNVRVLCWQMNINATSRTQGNGDVWPIECDVFEDITDRMQ